MKRMFAGVLMVAVLSLSACGEPSEGYVTDKVFKDAYVTQEEIMEEECEWDTDTKYVNGKSKTTREYECEQVGSGEYEDVEHPAQYIVVFEDDEGNEGDDEVSEDVYNSIEVGDFYKED